VRQPLTGAELRQKALLGGRGALFEVPDRLLALPEHDVGLADVEAGADPEPGLPSGRGNGQGALAGLDGGREVPLEVQGNRHTFLPASRTPAAP
jgi:hypothetical protein